MKKLLLLSLIIFAPALNAYFFAYQKWVNPKTGQVLEEYYDYHETNPENSDAQQRQDFIEDAKRYGKDLLVILEDPYDIIRAHINLAEHGIVLRPSPLEGLWKLCDQSNLDVLNVDCRNFSDLNPNAAEHHILHNILKQVVSYDDGPVLDEYYDEIHEASKADWADLQTFYKDNTPLSDEKRSEWDLLWKNYVAQLGFALTDAQALHAVYKTHKKRIKLAAGGKHLRNINYYLYQLGWRPELPVINGKLKQQIKSDDRTKLFINSIFGFLSSVYEADSQLKVLDESGFVPKLFPINLRAIHEQPAKFERQDDAAPIRSKL
ncbi:MAG TPA: hypothetical protein VFF04_02025 [Candidatus Babeliales bacterium]|nr:hypothetical protein [Candidatus Babeliales bacterium]